MTSLLQKTVSFCCILQILISSQQALENAFSMDLARKPAYPPPGIFTNENKNPQNKSLQKERTFSPEEENTKYPCLLSLAIRHIESEGVGYNEGYTTLAGLTFPSQKHGNFWPFLDCRLHHFNNNTTALNAGLGFRFLSVRSILGVNTYYDYRTSSQHFHFHQIGLGFEILSKRFDIRLNGYLPIKPERLIQYCFFNNYLDGYFISKKTYEGALRGVNFEIGKLIKKSNSMSMYGAIGPYYFRRKCHYSWGGKIRLTVNITKHLSLESNITHDDLFKTRAQGQISLNFPFRCPPPDSLQDTLSQPVQRNEIIVLDKYCRWKWNY